jgi:hypothetical protein
MGLGGSRALPNVGTLVIGNPNLYDKIKSTITITREYSPMRQSARSPRARHAFPALQILVTGLLIAACVCQDIRADEKSDALRDSTPEQASPQRNLFRYPAGERGEAQTIKISADAREFPVVVVHGTPYEMGRQLGVAIGDEMRTFVPRALQAIQTELQVSEEELCDVWARMAAFTDDRVEQELIGLADGATMPLATLHALHATPILMPYSCSSIAAWGQATEDGHLYQTRNLDWSLEVGAQDFPVIVVYVPQAGIPHVVPTFAGMIGAHTGMNLRGIALAEMGDAPGREMPYQVHAPHFTAYFRTMLYDADSLTRALDIFQSQPMTKRYHFVFGDGRKESRAVKVRAHSPEQPPIVIWKDNDPTDEFAPRVLPGVVYNDEGRGAFPTLQEGHGKLNAARLIDLANQIPIKGGNVVNVVYDATALRLWVSYAEGAEEAYKRPYAFLDLKTLDADRDGKPDLP